MKLIDDGGSVAFNYNTKDHIYINKAAHTMDLLGSSPGGSTKQTRMSLQDALIIIGTSNGSGNHAVTMTWEDDGTGGINKMAWVSPMGGSATAASHTFEGTAGDTGMYSTGAANVSFTSLGTRKAFIDPSGVNIPYATASKLVVTDSNKYLVSSSLSASDIPAETTYAEGNLGSLTWTAGVAPSGTITKFYRAVKQGSMVTVCFDIRATVAGTAVTAVSFALPNTLPTPTYFSDTANSNFDVSGSGSIFVDDATAPAAGPNICLLGKDGSGNALVTIVGPSLAAKAAMGTVTYFTF